MLTMKEAAAALDGNEYGKEGSKELFAQMKDAGLVAVFGASDDLMEVRGAVYDEAGAGESGGVAYFTTAGMLYSDCDDDACPYFAKLKEKASKVNAIWAPTAHEGASWLMETDLPHETFRIMEDGEVYCIGLVFDLKDCAA